MATELEKSPDEETEPEEKSSKESSSTMIASIPPSSPKRTDNPSGDSLAIPNIKILKYDYVTPNH